MKICAVLSFQLNCFKIAQKREIEEKTTICQLAKLLLLNHYNIASSFLELYFSFVFTLPVTVPYFKYPFAKLKLIKNFIEKHNVS